MLEIIQTIHVRKELTEFSTVFSPSHEQSALQHTHVNE